MQDNEARPHLFLRGYARIPISNLRFDTGREEDGNITSRLIKIFKSPRGCQNEDPANLISIVLEDDIDLQLSKAIHDAPLLDTRHVQAFTCLHGRHRVLAARKVLPARDRWWIAKVYDRDLPPRLYKNIQQQNQESHAFSDGEILYHLLDAQADGDRTRRAQLMATMSKWQSGQFLRLEKYDNGRLMKEIARLRPLKGMREGFGFGRLAPIFGMYWHEEVYAYIDTILRRWIHILGSEIPPTVVDEETVRCLEGMAPKQSLHDHETICHAIDEGHAFSSITSEQKRQAVKERLRECDRILTINSFFEDMIYARACFEALRTLLPPPSRQDSAFCVREAFRQIFLTSPSAFWQSYVSLWLWAMRNFAGLPCGKNGSVRVCKRRKRRMATGSTMHAELVNAARSLGFDIEEKDGVPADFTAGPLPEAVSHSTPKLSSYRQNVCEHARSNRPCESTYPTVADELHPSHVFKMIDEPPGIFVTPFALMRDVVLCFWGNEYDRQKGNGASFARASASETSRAEEQGPSGMQMTTMIRRLRAPSHHDPVGDDQRQAAEESGGSAKGQAEWSVGSVVGHDRTDSDLSEAGQVVPDVLMPDVAPYGRGSLDRDHPRSPAVSSIYSRASDEADGQLARWACTPSQKRANIGLDPDYAALSRGDRSDGQRHSENLKSPSSTGGMLMDRAVPEGTNDPSSHRLSLAPSPIDDHADGQPSLGAELNELQSSPPADREQQIPNHSSDVGASHAAEVDDVDAFLHAWDQTQQHHHQDLPVAAQSYATAATKSLEYEAAVDRDASQASHTDQAHHGKRVFDATGLHPDGTVSQSRTRDTSFPGQLLQGEVVRTSPSLPKMAWDAEEGSVVRSISALNRKLPSNKVYLASTHDIRAPSHRDPHHHRLWSWREDRRSAFMAAVQSLPSRLHLKLVKLSVDYREFECHSTDPTDCWDKLWESRKSSARQSATYPFAIVVESTLERSNRSGVPRRVNDPIHVLQPMRLLTANRQFCAWTRVAKGCRIDPNRGCELVSEDTDEIGKRVVHV